MASWDLHTRPKKAGVLGFTNAKIMNKYLLAKWVYKLENGEDTICCKFVTC